MCRLQDVELNSLVVIARHQDLDWGGLVGNGSQKMTVKSIGGHRSRQRNSRNVQLVSQFLIYYTGI